MTEKQLLAKKKEIENSKSEVSELKGEEKALLKQLKTDWKCTSLSAAKKKIEECKSKITELTDTIETATVELEEKYFNEEE